MRNGSINDIADVVQEQQPGKVDAGCSFGAENNFLSPNLNKSAKEQSVSFGAQPQQLNTLVPPPAYDVAHKGSFNEEIQDEGVMGE